LADDPAAVWRRAERAARCLAVAGPQLGGALIKAGHGPVREAWRRTLLQALPPQTAWRKVPSHCALEQLTGSLDLAATLESGIATYAEGLLAGADRGVVELAALDRTAPAVAGAIAQAIDIGSVTSRGGTTRADARFTVLAFVEGDEGGATTAALGDRLAFWLELDALPYRLAVPTSSDDFDGAAVRRAAARIALDDGSIELVAAAAAAFGIGSLRAPAFALQVARTLAALDGLDGLSEGVLSEACTMVLAPRATCLPEASDPEQDDPEDTAQQPDQPATGEPQGDEQERLIETIRAMLPADLLARLISAGSSRQRGIDGQAGQWQKPAKHGRPVGLRRGDIRRDKRLDLVASLTAAAPWQRLRRQHWHGRSEPPAVIVAADDLRFKLLKQRRGTLVVFLVDASGSAAVERLGEAKGAVELLLAQCYVRRDEAALIAFRQRAAELLLPPTRSLTRAKRLLAGLPGGGATPLAAALCAGARLAEQAKARGQSPFLVLLSDGRGNIDLDGEANRAKAREDAQHWATRLGTMRLPAVVIDTGGRRSQARPSPAPEIARAMGARYLPLPMADAAGLATAIEHEVRRA